jgi:hypothetical protein
LRRRDGLPGATPTKIATDAIMGRHPIAARRIHRRRRVPAG